ncbi:MAG TPA: hypothetical protein VF556_05515 [Pyrinomonadaceae bacterium]|jgi:hypothetical protein
MTKQTILQRFGSLVLMTIALLFIADIQAFAQKKDYKPGEKIEWKSSDYPETWVEATFVRPSQDGRQPIIREMPNEFHKDGFERGTQWDKIRPLSAKTANKTPVNTNQNANSVNDVEAENKTTTTKDFGSGLMTQAEILSFLQTKLGDKPFQNPRREEIKKELAEMIKVRGLDFRFDSTADFYSKLNKYVAMTSDITFPLSYNYGAPTRESWLTGAWQLGKIGAAVDYEKNNRIYRQGEIGVGNVGALTIKADGTYVWNAGAKNSTGGKWRKATREEMKDQGGDGIVLLKAKGGEDWIVMHDRNTTLKGDWINIYQLNWRQIKEYGSRGGKK